MLHSSVYQKVLAAALLAIFTTVSSSHHIEAEPNSTKVGLIIQSVDGEGTGFFVTVNHDNTKRIGFSPASFEVPSGQSVGIQVSGFGNFVFDHWKDNNATSSSRSVFLIRDSDLTAIYRNTSNNPS